MNKQEVKKREGWETKMLRGIFEGIKDKEGTWKCRTNKEIIKVYGKPTIIQRIRGQRVRWLGHMERMQPNRIPKTSIDTTTSERGEKKERQTQKEVVQEDLRGRSGELETKRSEQGSVEEVRKYQPQPLGRRLGVLKYYYYYVLLSCQLIFMLVI
ncbi:hypothetical protein RI129_005267 [Pyrocoelia pectoralis]|uniref:Uncharacterized protein n=1 Tax=Pyrocoelia pectoralis TaxID=417401 RepID=A0AAN7VKG3_9COLE